MPPKESSCLTISNYSVYEPVTTCAADEGLLADSGATNQRRDNVWQSVIDEKLIEWGANPDQFEHEEILAPTRTAIRAASEIAHAYLKQGVEAPTRVVPNGEGGIVFERIDGSTFEAIEIEADGQVEYRVFEKSLLVGRTRLR